MLLTPVQRIPRYLMLLKVAAEKCRHRQRHNGRRR